jgi:hypothetical protein
MKAYHLQKAHDPTDLPPWLFDERERRSLGLSITSGRYWEGPGYGGHESSEAFVTPRPPWFTGGLRHSCNADIVFFPSKDAQTILVSNKIMSVLVPHRRKQANDRLRALRDAKRSAAAQRSVPARDAYVDPIGYGGLVPVERGRRYSPDRGLGVVAHANRAPSLPASVRPTVGLPPRPAMRGW